jgi:hypothetical protein
MTAAVATAVAAAAVAAVLALAAFLLLRRARLHMRPLEEEIERGKTKFDEVVAREVEVRAAELERTLALARAESLAALGDEERRIAEERRRDVAEREDQATAKLGAALVEAQSSIEQRLADWSGDLDRLQEGLADELARLSQRQQALTSEIAGRIEQEGDQLQAAIEEHRALTTKLREDLARSSQDVAKAAVADLEQHATERRRALHEVAERLRVREREIQEQIEREQAESVQRIAVQLGDVEQRQLEQLRRSVSREATRYAEAAALQFDTTIRSAREEAARRLGRELDLAVERFSREAEGVLAERVDHMADAAAKRVESRIAGLGGGLDRQREDALRTLERRAQEVEAELRTRLELIAAEAETARTVLDARLHELQRRLDEMATRA